MKKNIAQCGLLISLALVLSIAERWIPLALFIPVPGIKLGLANIVTIFALIKLSVKEASFILLCRIILGSIFAGSVTSFLFSLFGGFFALIVMYVLLKFKNTFSIYGVSVAGAAVHNIGQIFAAMLVLKSVHVIAYLPMLLIFAIPLGIATGFISSVVVNRLKK